MTDLQVQSLRRETTKIRDQYARDLITAFNWSEDHVGLDRDTFCKYGPICEATTSATLLRKLPFDPDFQLVRLFPEPRDDLERTTPVSIPKSFCLAVESAGFAASSLALQDLESQPADEIYECLETLAGQKWSDRLGFWNLIKERIGDRIFNSDGRLQSGAVTILMPILDVIEADSFSENTMLMIDPFSYLGAMPGLTDKTVKTYAGKYSEVRQLATLISQAEDGKVGGEALEVAAIGNLVCGLSKGMVEDLLEKSDNQFNMLHLLGSTVTSCQDEKILKAIARKATNVPKPNSDWSQSDVAQFLRHGVFLAGFEPSEMSEWPQVIFKAFTPEITSHLTVKHLAALSPAQISAIPVDAMSVFNRNNGMETSAASLSNSQFEALTGKRESVVPMSWLDTVNVRVSRVIDDNEKEVGNPEPESNPEPEGNPDDKEEPESEPEGEPSSSLSDGGVSKSQLIAIIVSVGFLVIVLVCAAVCWYKSKCCCQKEPEA